MNTIQEIKFFKRLIEKISFLKERYPIMENLQNIMLKIPMKVSFLKRISIRSKKC